MMSKLCINMSVKTVESVRGGGRCDIDGEDCQRAQFVELQDENMPPKVSSTVTAELEKRLDSLPIEGHMKARVRAYLNSNSASARVKAIRVINSGRMDVITAYDVPHGSQELVTEEERRQAERPPPKFRDVMANVVVYVEVRSGRDDRTNSIKTVIRDMGVKVNDTFLKNTTHVIFREGRLSTYNKAKKSNIPIVSILWIEACKKSLKIADPERFRPHDLECYENPELYKIKRHKFMNIDCERERKVSSKSLLENPASPALARVKQLSKTSIGTPCDTPETKFIKNILVAPGRGEKTDTATKKTLNFDDTSVNCATPKKDTFTSTFTPRRSARRASCTSAQVDTPTSFKPLRKSTSMELSLLDSHSSAKMDLKLDNISESDEMELTEIAPKTRMTTLAVESMIESPKITSEETTVASNRWTTVNGESEMEVIKDDVITPEKLIFCSGAAPGSSRRSTIFQHRIQMISQSAKVEKKSSPKKTNTVKEYEDVLKKSPREADKAKPRRRTLCPIPKVVDYPEAKVESQPKRRKLFHQSAVTEVMKTPKQPVEMSNVAKNTPKTRPKTAPRKSVGSKRGSILEFETVAKDLPSVQKSQPSLVVTNISGKDRVIIEEAVEKLGGFRMASSVTRDTTHLVTENPSRTLNTLRALIRGVWILSVDWIRASVAEDKWLPEESFELRHFAPAVTVNRLERQLLGRSFKMNLLKSGSIYVSRRCSAAQDIRELIILCGGRLVSKSLAQHVLSPVDTQRPADATLLHPNWIVDSILARELLPESQYSV